MKYSRLLLFVSRFRKELFMPIYRKKITEKSSCIFEIDAPDQDTADKIFDEFFKEDGYNGVSYDEYREHMNECVMDEVEDLPGYSNWDEYNRSKCPGADIILEYKPEHPEPLYDLCLFTTYNSLAKDRKIYEDLDMTHVAIKLHDLSKEYILDPTVVPPYDLLKSAIERGTHIMCYKLIRREANG